MKKIRRIIYLYSIYKSISDIISQIKTRCIGVDIPVSLTNANVITMSPSHTASLAKSVL